MAAEARREGIKGDRFRNKGALLLCGPLGRYSHGLAHIILLLLCSEASCIHPDLAEVFGCAVATLFLHNVIKISWPDFQTAFVAILL